jgi:2-polyprenyl-3-methyl-5-hydroxy-6-metoxy-1,4-benzoquinol methylase
MSLKTPTRPLSADELNTVFLRALGDPPEPEGSAGAPPAGALTGPPDINALMGLDDRSFVEHAYGKLLGRSPDEVGLRHYLARLDSGASRIMVLGELRYGPEGRRVATPVPGLRSRFLLHRLYQVKLFGRGLRVMSAIVALPGLMRDVGRLGRDNSRLWGELQALRAQAEQEIAATARETRRRAEFAEAGLLREARARAELGQRLEKLEDVVPEDTWEEPLLALADRNDAQAARLVKLERVMDAAAEPLRLAASLAADLAILRENLGLAANQAGAIAEHVQAVLTEQRNLAQRAIGAAEETKAGLRDQERRLSLILGEVRAFIAHGADAEAAVARIDDTQAELLDPLYVEFEDRFRGTRADIKQRQSVYLDTLRQAGAGAPDRPIVDVGSGRGELLELLGDQGLAARGVDMNATMVSVCTQAGLDCVRDDAVAYLGRAATGSLGAVTGFHIIEHLPFEVMVALFDASLRALAPGGIVIFETPNPANLLVASRWFYLDPTHRNPLPGEMVAMIAEARGFVDVRIRELHPMQRRFEAQDGVLAAQLDDLFFGPQDYALIARKP